MTWKVIQQGIYSHCLTVYHLSDYTGLQFTGSLQPVCPLKKRHDLELKELSSFIILKLYYVHHFFDTNFRLGPRSSGIEEVSFLRVKGCQAFLPMDRDQLAYLISPNEIVYNVGPPR